MSDTPINPGDCFKVVTSYGGGPADGSTWFIYRRVRKTIAGFAECYRFESRSDGAQVLYHADACPLAALKKQERIAMTEWLRALQQFGQEVNEPWNVE